MRYNFRPIVFCPRCLDDVEEDIGYLEWKHWKYCPNCGCKLVHVPLGNRPSEIKEYLDGCYDEMRLELNLKMYDISKDPKWIEMQPGVYKDGLTIFERLEEIRKVRENEDKTKEDI